MIANPVGIQSASSVGGGLYTLNLFFQDTNLAKFLNIGDQVTDTAANTYTITHIPSTPFVSGASLTLSFATTDTIPINDTGFDSIVFTPGQVDVRPEVRSAVFITGVSIFDAQNYEYTVQANVADLIEANQAIVGDSLVDLQGKEYSITFIDPTNRFTVPFRVTETAREGSSPLLGDGALYRPTAEGLFQGTEIADPSRTVIRNRDNFLIDSKLKDLQDQINSSTNSGEVLEASYTNSTGTVIPALTAISTNSSGNMKVIQVDVETEVQALKGVTVSSVPDSSSGSVAKAGILKNVSTLFDLQDALYVAKDGTLTNIPPEIGSNGFVAGDFVIYIGHISRNEDNPANKDLELRPQVIGQL